MLTEVILDGPMGKTFGRKWSLAVDSPQEALNLIDANRPGLLSWIKNNLKRYSRYKVICQYENGQTEHLGDSDYGLTRKCKSIRFVPVIEGAGGGALQTVIGIALIGVSVWNPALLSMTASMQAAMFGMGMSMAIGGIASMLAPKPSSQNQAERKDKTSYYFDGPTNTTMQGVPVQLIYGKCMVGSHGISAAVTIDQMM